MKLTTFLLPVLISGSASAHPFRDGFSHYWRPGGPHDFRGPCPMMNTLANHGYLPRNGKDLTRPVVVDALTTALHFNESLANLMFDMAIIANPEPNATFFTLDQLNRHNVLEHDASLSRSDAYFGNNHVFNKTIFDTTRAYWTAPKLTAAMLANSKIARQIESKAYNPTYRFTATTEDFSLGEVAAPIIVFGDLESGTVDRALIEYFFQHERLPTALGWKIRDPIVNVEDVMRISGMIHEATNLLTDSDSGSGSATTGMEKRWDLHVGRG